MAIYLPNATDKLNVMGGHHLLHNVFAVDSSASASSVTINSAGHLSCGKIIAGEWFGTSIDLTSKVTGTLPVANGGTSYTSGTISRIKYGTYTGDGQTTKAITGVGFQAKYLRIWSQGASYAGVECEKTTQDGLYSRGGDPNTWQYLTDGIISLDADGFTVGDGTGWANNWWNFNNEVYTYIAFG